MVQLPVRGIQSDLEVVDAAVNRKYFHDYECVTIPQVGHYPMLEKPEELNRALEACLRSMALV